MATLLIAIGAGLAFIVAYHTYGRWLGSKIFNVSAGLVCPSHRLRDDKDYVPTPKMIVFGHHFTSIAGTGPIVGPAIAVMWGWVPALLWVVFGSIFIGAVHDFGALVVSLRNNGQTVGDIAGRVLNKRVRLLFLFVLFMALTIVLAIFGLVIAAVFRQYPSAIFPCLVQIPIAVVIGLWLHRKGVNILLPSILALVVMYLTVVFGDENTPIADMAWLPGFLSSGINAIEATLHSFNTYMASLSTITWVMLLLVYSYVASVLPVWTLLQPRDYINSLQLVSALALIVLGLVVAAAVGGAPPVEGAERQTLEIVAPAFKWEPAGAPLIFPFLFVTIACGAISGFHCLVSSGTSSKQLDSEKDARFVGYGSMLTEGFLATLVILACVAGLGLGLPLHLDTSMHMGTGGMQSGSYVGEFQSRDGDESRAVFDYQLRYDDGAATFLEGKIKPSGAARDIVLGPAPSPVHVPKEVWRSENGFNAEPLLQQAAVVGPAVFNTRYQSWSAAGGLASTVGAFVDGAANFLKAMGIPTGVAVALMGVLVASFAGTTLDTACRLQRYVIQELASTFMPQHGEAKHCPVCSYDLTNNVSGQCPECGWEIDPSRLMRTGAEASWLHTSPLSPLMWLRNKHGATIVAVGIAIATAAMPNPGADWTWANAGKGGLILWPMFGATNQLLGGLAFLVIAFYLWRRNKPVWFLILPLIFMLIIPAWAMMYLLFVKGINMDTSWLDATQKNWPLIAVAIATLVLEVWMIVEAVLLMPRVRGVLEKELPGSSPTAAEA